MAEKHRGSNESMRETTDVVARPIVDSAVGDADRIVEAAILEALGEVVGDAHDAGQAALADDRVVGPRPVMEISRDAPGGDRAAVLWAGRA